MRLDAVEPDTIAFTRRRQAKSSLLIGIALSVMATLPLALGSGEMAPRAITSLAIGALAIFFVFTGWPHLERVVANPGDGTVRAGGKLLKLEEGAAFRLTARSRSEDFGWPLYGVEIPATNGQSIRLLENASPEEVLRDLAQLRERWPLPVTSGWGLPAESSPWLFEEARPARAPGPTGAPELTVRGTDVVAQGETGKTAIVAALAIAFLMLRAVATQLSAGDGPLVLDFALPAITITLIVIIGLAVLTRSVVVRCNGTWSIERRMLGLCLGRTSLPRSAVRAAHVVGPHRGEAWHVMLETEQGPVAIPSYDGRARKLRDALAERLQGAPTRQDH